MAEETKNSWEFSSASQGYFGDGSFSIAPHLQEVTTMDHTALYSNSLVLNSPGCAAKGRSVKEFEEQLSGLKKENFNLKLRIYFLEERMGTNFNMKTEEVVKKNVELMVDVETLKKELNEKHEMLCEAAKAMELEDEEHKRVLREKESLVSSYLKELELLKTQIVKQTSGVDVSVQSPTERANSRDHRFDLLVQELEKAKAKIDTYERDLRAARKSLEEAQAKCQCLARKSAEGDRMMESVMLENGELHMTCASLKAELERECRRHERLKASGEQKIGELQRKLEAALGELKKSQELVVPIGGAPTRPERPTDAGPFSVPQPAAPARPAQADAVAVPAARPALMAAAPASPPPPSLVDLGSLGQSGDMADVVERLEAERELHQQKIVKLKSEQMKACNIIKSMIESKNKANEEITDLRKRNEKLAKDLHDAQKHQQQNSLSAIEEELDDYKLLTDELEEKNRILTATLSEIRSQFEATQTKNAQLLDQIAERDNKITDLEFEVISQSRQSENGDASLKEKDAEISVLRKKSEKLTCDLQLLVNKELWSKNREIEKLQKAQTSISAENKEDVSRLNRELATKEGQLRLLKERIADLGIDFDPNCPPESPGKSRLKSELEKSESLRSDAVKVCAILSVRLEELALFLDSLLRQKSVLGFLNRGEDVKIRKAINESLDLSRGFSLGGITDESLRQFLTDKCDLSFGDLSLTYQSHMRLGEDPEDSQIIDALRQQIVNLQCELQVRDVELGKLGLGGAALKEVVEAQSESEAWSEPDRSVSKARIGLDDSIGTNRANNKANASSDSGELVRKSPKKNDNKIVLLQRQLHDLTERLKETETLYSKEQAFTDKMAQEVDDLNAKLKEAETRAVKAEVERKECEEKMAELESDFAELDTIRLNLLNNMSTKDKELQNRLNELEVDRQQSVNAAKKAEIDLKTCQKEIEDLSNEIATIKVSYEGEIKRTENEIESLQNIVKDLHREIAENYLLKSEVVESFEENERLKEALADYKAELDLALDRENTLKAKLVDLQGCIDVLRGDLDGATLQYSEAVLEKTKITNEKIFLEQDRSRLLAVESETKSALVNLEKEIAQLRSNYAAEKSLTDMQQSRLYIQISELESTNAELHNKLVRIQASGCLDSNKSPENRRSLLDNNNHSDLEEVNANRLSRSRNNVYVADLERQETNSSPDLGIESDHGRFSSLENHISRPFLQTLELTESMNNLLDVDTCQNQYPECCDNDLCCQKSLKVIQENTDLRRRLLKARKALEETVTQLTLANQRKKQVEKTICKQIHKTSQVLRKAKANLDSGSETEAYKK